MPGLQRETRFTLLDALGKLPNIGTPAGRGFLVDDWPPTLRDSLTPTNSTILDLSDIIAKAEGWVPQGADPPPLLLVIDRAVLLVRGTTDEQTLTQLRATVQQQLAPAPPPQPLGAPPLLSDAEAADRFTQVVDAFTAGQYDQVVTLAAALPADYPGLARFVTAAQEQKQAAKDAADAIVSAFIQRKWQDVLTLADQYKAQGVTLVASAQLIIARARQQLAPAQPAPA